MGINYFIGKTIDSGGTISNEFVQMDSVLVPKSGGTFSGPVNASAFVGDGAGLTNIPSGRVSGATFDGTILTIENSDGSNINAPLTGMTFTGDGATIEISLENFLVDGKQMGDSSFKHWAEMYVTNNTTATIISAASTPVKTVGATTLGDGSRGFTMPIDNRLFYTGTTTGQTFEVTASISGEASSGSQSAQFMIYKNGITLIPQTITETEWTSSKRSLSLTGTFTLVTNDFIELWCQNNASNKNLEAQTFTVRIAQV